jgi:hypothetical protein
MKKNRKRTVTPCRWIREHNGSMKPEPARRLAVGTTVYSVMNTGQIMLERTAKKLGLFKAARELPTGENQ